MSTGVEQTGMDDRVRILVAVGSMAAGGAERQVLEILKHLDRKRFVPQLYLSQRIGDLLPLVPNDVPIHAASDWPATLALLPGSRMLARWWVLRSLLIREQIDVVYDRTYLATLDAAWPCWSTGTPHIAACVGDPLAELHRYRRLPMPIVFRWARWAYGTAYRVVTNSHGLLGQFQKLFSLPADQVRVMPNLYDLDEIEAKSLEVVPPLDQTRFNVLTVGRIDQGKAYPVLLAALVRLETAQANWHWHVLGTGSDEAALKQDVASRGLSERVTFHGVVTNPFPFYRHCQLFVLPSRSEGLPNVLIEALACGQPVISTDCPSGPAEILAYGRFGTLVPVDDEAAMAAAIMEVVMNREESRAKTQLGQQSVRERYSIEAVLPQLEALLLEACGQISRSQ
jgi:glycosyltransferase involved in cell wall biosynthesis